MNSTFASLFAGIGGFDRGFLAAGYKQTFSVEIDDTCNAVRKRHWPDEEQHTDVTAFTVRSTAHRPRLICGGFPCQDLSVAGKRSGLAGERSGLFFEFMRIVEEFAPRWVLIENVVGLLSSNGGRDMGTVLRSLAELGYGTAYRVLDSQWFGVPQRRRRVFIIGCLGDWRRAAEVLFESESLPWDSAPSRETGTQVAASLTRGADSSGKGGYAGRRREDDVNLALIAFAQNQRDEIRDLKGVSGALAVEPGMKLPGLRVGGEETAVVIPIDMRQASRGGVMTNNRKEGSSGGAPGTGIGQAGDPSPTLADSHTPAVYQCHGSNVGPMGSLRQGNGNVTGGVPFVFQERGRDGGRNLDTQDGLAYALCNPGAGGRSQERNLYDGMQVRRLTPVECERLQAFPDDWTRYRDDGTEISDSARYRILGNAVTVSVAEWIGRRIMEAQCDP